MKKRGIPYVEIDAENNYEFGFKLGKALKKEIQYRLEKNKDIYKKKARGVRDFSLLVNKARKFIPLVNKNFPKLLEEARGIADGANVPFQELFVLMSEEQIVDYKILHCTSLAVKTKDNKILLGNNEDWVPEYRKNGLALIKGQIKDNKFLALTYIGNMAGSSTGLNSSGVAYSDNSFVLSRFSYGVPRSFHLRALLDVKNPDEAIKILDTQGSIGSNTMLVFSNKKIIDIEELWSKDDVFKARKWIVHTNHPLISKYQSKKNTKRESILRFNRAREIILKEKELTLDTLKKILRDHKAKICEHPKRRNTPCSVATIASFIINPKDKYMLLCSGNPCRNKYKKYYLK